MRTEHPLKWNDWPRTLPEKQINHPGWKKPMSFYEQALETEFKRMGVMAAVITVNDSYSRDPGVCVWFSRKREEDFTWRDILKIAKPYPSVEDIHDAYKLQAKIHHPDTGGDIEIFKLVEQAKRTALAWADRAEGKRFDYAIAADSFRERRLNLAAIVGTIQAIRKIERCGTSALMERTFQAFAALNAGEAIHANASS
jgi:hypothetical protein